MKDFDDFLKRGVVKKQSVNEPRAKDLVSEAERKLSSMNRVIKKIGIDDANANDIIENCCDIILSLIRSKMFLKGVSASGSGAHEAEVSFLKKLEFNEQQIEFINSLRYFRNGILYYGKRFDKEYAKKVVKFLKQVKVKLK